jgi:hypothetical protein
MENYPMKKIVCLLFFAFVFLQVSAFSQAGTTKTIFNKKFIPTIKPAMTYEEIVKIVGAPGAKIGEDKKSTPPTTEYKWTGSRQSVLTVKFRDSKMVEATVLVPSKHTFHIQQDGKVVDVTK